MIKKLISAALLLLCLCGPLAGCEGQSGSEETGASTQEGDYSESPTRRPGVNPDAQSPAGP